MNNKILDFLVITNTIAHESLYCLTTKILKLNFFFSLRRRRGMWKTLWKTLWKTPAPLYFYRKTIGRTRVLSLSF